MYNPDYPTDNTGAGFIQHTYQQQSNEYNYWGGMNPYGNAMNPYGDSRRNMNMQSPMNPVNPFNQFGQVGMNNPQNNTIPEQNVQPFSSYPPSTPNGNNQASMPMGLNSFIDSRRNIPSVLNTTTQNNPWAQQTQQPNNNFMQTPYNQPQQMSGYFNNGYYPDMSTMALYGNNGNNSFTNGNNWDNYYTQSRPLPMPMVQWNNQQNPYNQPQQMMPQYPIQQFPTAQQNWKDIAERNWANSKI